MKTALGKGLNALIPDKGLEIVELDINRVSAGPEQPRREFKDDSLRELAASIKEKGVLQPVIVRRGPSGTFTLIAGERRYRASSMAGLKKIPAIIRDAADEDALEIALIENIQREDLNPMETASAFDRLMKQFGLTQEQLSDKVGKERATVANYLRLLQLPREVRELVSKGSLSMGHARAILSIEGDRERIEAARRIISEGLSVRKAEGLKKAIESTSKTKGLKKGAKTPEVKSLEEKLIKSLGTKVEISHSGKKGSIRIEYYSLEELDRLLDVLL